VFYSKDDPSWYDVENPEFTPWAGPDRIARDGVAIVCPLQDRVCIEKTRKALGPNLREQQITTAKQTLWRRLTPYTVLMLMRLPETRTAPAH
jgi:hypothetical protein